MFKVSRSVDSVRGRMAKSSSDLTLLEWIRVYEIDHVIYTWRLYNMVAGFEELKLKNISSPRTCKFGLWYYSVTDSRLLENIHFKYAGDLHEALHEKGVECFNSNSSGDKKNALLLFDEATKILSNLVTEINEIKNLL